MHLHDHPGALRQRHADVLARRPAPCRRAPRRRARARRRARSLASSAGAAEAGPALARSRRVLGLRVGDLVGRHPEQDHVVHDVGLPGQHVEAGDEGVLASAAGRAGSSGSRRCRCRRAPRACRPPASPAGPAALARAQRLALHRCRGRPGVAVGDRPTRLGTSAAPRTCRCRSPVPQAASTSGQQRDDDGRRTQACAAAHPGGQVIDRPPSTCRWAWKTVWCAAGAGVEDQPVALAEALLRRRPPPRRRTGRRARRARRPRARRRSAWWLRGITSTWVGACGSRSRNATVVSVSCTTSAWMSPATILQNRQSASGSVAMAPSMLRGARAACKPPGDRACN